VGNKKLRIINTETDNLVSNLRGEIGGWPTLSLISTPEGAPSLCLRSLQTQGGDFDFLCPEGPLRSLFGDSVSTTLSPPPKHRRDEWSP